jgi:hypothetical protein
MTAPAGVRRMVPSCRPRFVRKGRLDAAVAANVIFAVFTIKTPTPLEVDATRKNCASFIWGIFYGLRRGNRNFGAAGH